MILFLVDSSSSVNAHAFSLIPIHGPISSEHSNRENISLERNISKKEKMDLLQETLKTDRKIFGCERRNLIGHFEKNMYRGSHLIVIRHGLILIGFTRDYWFYFKNNETDHLIGQQLPLLIGCFNVKRFHLKWTQIQKKQFRMFQIWINLGRVLASLIGSYFTSNQRTIFLHQSEST